MGLCQSKEEKTLQQRSRGIDREIRESAIGNEKAIKLLLLGAGGSGKSTVLKQMRILHSSGFTPEELIKQRLLVFENIIQAMDTILRAMKHYGVNFSDPTRKADAAVIAEVISINTGMETITCKIATAIKNLWKDPAIQLIYERRDDFHLHDSAKHFFDSIDRIAAVDYKPSEQDILLTRVKTTGIVEVDFVIKNVRFRIFDVGGQRSERKKWIHCFEDVHAIIYVAAISEYAEVLFEDNTTNRMLKVCVYSNRYVIVDGPETYEDSIAFIRKRFEALNNNPDKAIYVHQTCATDTGQQWQKKMPMNDRQFAKSEICHSTGNGLPNQNNYNSDILESQKEYEDPEYYYSKPPDLPQKRMPPQLPPMNSLQKLFRHILL
ncbi:Guanine nucleotide-binding protein G(O) subunit alpha [Dirofilaria immitis]|nr:Guanine nucleotide-binding protein G(O) subunit alpha [Dirofilaria immitis]